MPLEHELPEDDAKRDSELQRDVRAELDLVADHDRGGPSAIAVAVRHGVVYLTGSADSYARKWAVERAASRIVGVRELRDHVEVHPAGGHRRGDLEIERAATCALAWDARVPAGVLVRVTDGALRLQGAVVRRCEREAAEEAVRNLIGVRDIVNEITLSPGPAPADLERQVEGALHRLYGADGGGISITVLEGVVTLSGVVPSLATLDEVERVVRSVPAVSRVVTRLVVA